MKQHDDDFKYRTFLWMSQNFERLQDGEIKSLANDMCEFFNFDYKNALAKLHKYYYNRTTAQPRFEELPNGDVLIIYQSKI